MGIYSDGKVYGISFMLNKEEEAVYEVKSDLPLTPQQIKDIKDYYETVKQKYVSIRYYAQCSSTYGPQDTFYTWFPLTVSLESLLPQEVQSISSSVVKSSSS
jgi:hypothetical protein